MQRVPRAPVVDIVSPSENWNATETGECLAGGSEEAVGEAAETAIDVCLGLGREHLLWSDVVPRFAQAGGASRGRLLEGLLPRIMAGQLQALAPEVMQVRSSSHVPSEKSARLSRFVPRRSRCLPFQLEDRVTVPTFARTEPVCSLRIGVLHGGNLEA